MKKDALLDLRVMLLAESMTKSDKKDIDKMISRALAAEKVANKKEIKKAVDKEMKSRDVKKMISDIVAGEIKSSLKNGDAKDMTVDITKKVLFRLYRELAYNYTPVIDRIKI